MPEPAFLHKEKFQYHTIKMLAVNVAISSLLLFMQRLIPHVIREFIGSGIYTKQYE